MTVISTVISQSCIAHASDSLITERQPDGTYKTTESEQSKIIVVRQWRGAMAYWGLATFRGWSTFDSLREFAAHAGDFSSAEQFATALAERLEKELSRMRFSGLADAGVGIHFTAYEYINDYWIPELFLISNWADTSYASLRRTGVGASRETYHSIAGEPPRGEDREVDRRLQVNAFLQQGNILIYNNGDPMLFNPAANGVAAMFGELARRGRINVSESAKTFTAIARRPIEIVANAQRDFCSSNMRMVGGKLHDLTTTPGGVYISTTGDAE